jgi:hypothetical protein
MPLETLPRAQRGGVPPQTVGVTVIDVAGAHAVARRGVVFDVANVAAGAVVSFGTQEETRDENMQGIK